MPFFKRPHSGLRYGDEEAWEIIKNIKMKYFPANQKVYEPGEYTNCYYFILRGKVTIGVDNNSKKH